MEIRLPNGVVIEDAPSGADPQALAAAVAAGVTPNEVDPPAAAQAAVRQAYTDRTALERANIQFFGSVDDIGTGMIDLLQSSWAGTLGVGDVTDPLTGETLNQQADRWRRERSLRDLGAGISEDVAGFAGSAIPDLALGRFGPLTGITAGGAVEGLRAERGERVQGAALGVIGGAAGEAGGRALGWFGDHARDVIRRAGEAAGEVVTPLAEAVKSRVNWQARSAGYEMALDAIARKWDTESTNVWRRLVEIGDELGFKSTPGQRSRNQARLQWEAGQASTPFGVGAFAEMADHNGRTLAQRIMGVFGLNRETVDPESLNAVGAMLGERFSVIADELGEDALAGTSPAALSRFHRSLRDARQMDTGDLLSGGKPDPQLAAALQALDQQVPYDTGLVARGATPPSGRTLMEWRSRLLEGAQDDRKRGAVRMAFGDAIDALDDLIVESAGPELGQAYADTRSMYRFFKVLEGSTQSAVSLGGDVSARRLAARLSSEYPNEFRLMQLSGQQGAAANATQQALADAFDAIRWGATVGYDTIPNSGTPSRKFFQDILLQGGVPETAYAAGRAALAGLGTRASLRIPAPLSSSITEVAAPTARAAGAAAAAREADED